MAGWFWKPVNLSTLYSSTAKVLSTTGNAGACVERSFKNSGEERSIMPITPASPCFVWSRIPGKSKNYCSQEPGDQYWSPDRKKAYRFATPAYAVAFLLQIAKADRMDMRLEYGVEGAHDEKEMTMISPFSVPTHRSDQQNPLCYSCVYRAEVPFSCHSACRNAFATVVGSQHGIKHGWFSWPFDFDPIWLEACSGFIDRKKLEESKNRQTCPNCHTPVENGKGLCDECWSISHDKTC